ncbi:helix-hairpin-helix domain-containing protein [Miniphocaeibacter massiliensis]|uniref:helix-hairpin-helix domain-containing protein n=1 Tax=Miniphocaeibacter massiliensis TaxID=2041841 RepID=UPI0013ECDF27|nr:helix-hairpin-helix domain-containing protein [Miniphocaeibacter massiliensis]
MKKYVSKDRIIIVIFILIIAGYGFHINRKNNGINNIEKEIITTELFNNEVKDKFVYVHIDGEVNNPGMYKLTSNDRINDAVIKAGGLKDTANTKNINLSKKLEDEMKINIPSDIINQDSDTSVYDEKTNNNYININIATKEELMSLSGIGEIKAESIIKYRENKKFSKVEDIMNVNGIGEKLFDSIKDYISIN